MKYVHFIFNELPTNLLKDFHMDLVYYIAKAISTRNIKINNTHKSIHKYFYRTLCIDIPNSIARRLHSWRLKYNNLLFDYTHVHVHVQYMSIKSHRTVR